MAGARRVVALRLSEEERARLHEHGRQARDAVLELLDRSDRLAELETKPMPRRRRGAATVSTRQGSSPTPTAAGLPVPASTRTYSVMVRGRTVYTSASPAMAQIRLKAEVDKHGAEAVTLIEEET